MTDKLVEKLKKIKSTECGKWLCSLERNIGTLSGHAGMRQRRLGPIWNEIS